MHASETRSCRQICTASLYIYMYINCMHVPWLEKLELCNVLIAGRSNQKHIYIYIYIVYISVFYVAFRAPIVLLRA